MELRHLRYFIALAEELNFRRAAERLHISQPPLSQQIHQLEEEIGVELISRTKRQIELTQAGHAFLDEARQTLLHASKATRDAQAVNRGELGELVIGFVQSTSQTILPQIILRFKDQVPGVELVVREMHSPQLVTALHTHRIHVAFVLFPVKREGLIIEIVERLPMGIVLPTGHRLAAQPVVSLGDLHDDDGFLMPERAVEPAAYDYLLRAYHEAGLCPHIIQETNEMYTMLGMVAVGLGVSLAPAYIGERTIEGIVYRPLTVPLPPSLIAMARRCEEPEPALARFLQIAHAAIEAQDGVPTFPYAPT
jgi:DNA-binding transcriptional LysR family regulator